MNSSGRVDTPQETDLLSEYGTGQFPEVQKPFIRVYPRKGLLATQQTFSFFSKNKKGFSDIHRTLNCSGVPVRIEMRTG
jgi:hypothetical protein